MHWGIKSVPYVLTYGHRPRVGISGLPIDSAVLDALATADLNALIEISELENAALEEEVEEVEAGNALDEVAANALEKVVAGYALEEEDPDYGLKPAARATLEEYKTLHWRWQRRLPWRQW